MASLSSKLLRWPTMTQGTQLMPVLGSFCFHTQSSPLNFHLGTFQNAMPPKKQTSNIQQDQLRTQRKRRRIEKMINQIHKYNKKFNPKNYKDCWELNIDPRLRDPERQRPPRNLSRDDIIRGRRLLREALMVSMTVDHRNVLALRACYNMKQKALEELRKESQELYIQAVQPIEDLSLLSHAPVTETPAIPGYVQDGEYKDVSPVF